MKTRFSILRLMAFVLVVAVGLAAARAGAFAFAVVTLSATTLGAVLSRDPTRAFFLGCSVFGWASMMLAFGAGQDVRSTLPTVRPIVRIYEAINGPGPAAFRSPEEAGRWVGGMVESVNRAITVGHSLIALALGLAGGAATGLFARRREKRAVQNTGPPPSSARSPEPRGGLPGRGG